MRYSRLTRASRQPAHHLQHNNRPEELQRTQRQQHKASLRHQRKAPLRQERKALLRTLVLALTAQPRERSHRQQLTATPFSTRRPFGHGAEHNEIHSQGGARSQVKLDLMLARIAKHFYRDNSPETWHKKVRTFLLGCHSDMVLILDWIEARGKM